jgi:hypothetical protein
MLKSWTAMEVVSSLVMAFRRCFWRTGCFISDPTDALSFFAKDGHCARCDVEALGVASVYPTQEKPATIRPASEGQSDGYGSLSPSISQKIVENHTIYC